MSAMPLPPFRQSTRELEYAAASTELFAAMLTHPPLADKFEQLDVAGGFIQAIDQFGRPQFTVSFGDIDPDYNPKHALELAVDAATRAALPGCISSRETRLAEIERYAGGFRCMHHVVACRFMAPEAMPVKARIELEDASELFVIALARKLYREYKLTEMTRDMAKGYLFRYESPLLALFKPFIDV